MFGSIDNIFGKKLLLLHLDAHLFFGEVPDVPFTGNDFKTIIQKVFNGFGFGGGLNDNQTFHSFSIPYIYKISESVS